jgi:hypothetical protein
MSNKGSSLDVDALCEQVIAPMEGSCTAPSSDSDPCRAVGNRRPERLGRYGSTAPLPRQRLLREGQLVAWMTTRLLGGREGK